MKVTLSHNQNALEIDGDAVASLVKEFCSFQQITCNEVIVHFIDVTSITALHSTFFQDPTPTDCITFPIDPPAEETDYCILGEIFVCPQVAVEYAAAHGDDPYKEVALYIVHGLLHLLGYRDRTDAERAEMRHQEARAMRHLDTISLAPYPTCALMK